MSELILLRNKIKTIQTIQKITHTMRLIAMSEHTTLKKRESNTSDYIKAVQHALKMISELAQEKINKQGQQQTRALCIVIGSQKGLCGSFNVKLESVFHQYQSIMYTTPFDLALIGAQIIKNKLFFNHQHSIVYKQPKLTQKTSSSVLQALKIFLPQYNHVSIISNHFRSFFVQQPHITTLIPINQFFGNPEKENTITEYLCEESIETIYDLLLQKYIHAQLSFLLYQSLLSEHAARFTSMDTANRNAKIMLDETKIKYNKLRQAKITTEINELSANFF